MSVILGFLPFILFSVLERQIGVSWALWIAAGVALTQILRGIRRQGGGGIKLLDGAAAALFLALAVAVTFVDTQVPPLVIRMTVNVGLALIALGSMLIGRPFTLQYAREQVAPEFWNSPLFIRTNYRITGVWSAAFVIQALASAAGLAAPDLPPALPRAVGIAALVGAILFTIEYPKRVRARVHAAAASNASGGTHG